MLALLRDEANKQQLDSLQRILTKGGVHSAFIKLAAAGPYFFLFVIAGRALSVSSFALFGFGFSAATMLVLVGSIGQRLLALKYVPVYVERNDKDTLASFSRRAYKIVLFGCSTVGVLFLSLSWFKPELGSFNFLLSVVFFGLVLGIAELQSRILRGHGSLLLALHPREVIWRLVVIIFFILIMLGSIDEPSPVSIFFFMGSTLLLITAWQGLQHWGTHPSFLMKKAKIMTKNHSGIALQKATGVLAYSVVQHPILRSWLSVFS